MLTRIAPALATCLVALAVQADLMPPAFRTPQFPLKTQRMLVSDGEIALAREQIERYETAKGIADTIIQRANAWLAWEDADLRALVPTADVTRAFNVGTAGCPQCGQQIYAKGGAYPWIIDPRNPFKVTCPVDGSTYPSNDYAAYYASGLNDTALLTGDYPDDGWGWVGTDGHRYWFVAYANHWTWRNHIIPAAQYLGRAYILTGDKAYARKAIVLLDRIAEVYPNMDYHVQSRYGQLQAANGSRYEGKIINLIWETGVLTMLAESYDFAWDAIDDTVVAGKTGEQIRANIEANLLEEGIDAYFSGKARGNFGMHQKALVYLGLARQFGKQDEWFDGLLNDAGANDRMTGLNYALYNLVFRDGPPYETAPGYNFSWVANITTVADVLDRAGYDVYSISKMRRLYDGVLDVVNIDRYTPSVGDSGSVYGGFVGQDPYVYQSAYRAYGDARYRDHLQSFGATGDAGIRRFESLFVPVVEPAAPVPAPVRSRLLDGYGMAILNNPSNTVSLSLYYGYKGGHGHFDRLHVELFANGQVMMPDLGYPDFMNAYVPGIYTWSKNTIAHNTVAVDETHQPVNKAATVNLFVDAGFARALDIDATPTYPQTSVYRRQTLLIDCDETHAYLIDAFTVTGGSQHDYSLHGPPGSFESAAGDWSEPAPGTLAGPDVTVGALYDAPAMAVDGYSGGYVGYAGSGYQHFINVQRLTGGAAAGVWTHERDEQAKVRIDILEAPGEVLRAQAQVSPVSHRELLTYFLARASGERLRSRFVSVIEPFQDTPWLQERRVLALAEGEGSAMEIRWQAPGGAPMRDVVLVNTGNGPLNVADGGPNSDARFAIVRYRGDMPVGRWSVGGAYLSVEGASRPVLEPVVGTVTRVEPDTGRVHVACETTDLDLQALSGSIAHFENAQRRTAHPIQNVTAEDGGLVITVGDDLKVGRVRIAEVRPEGLATATGLAFAPVYDGAYATDPNFTTFVPVRDVRDGIVAFVEPCTEATPFETGADAWIVNVGPGDHMEIPRVTVVGDQRG